MDNSAARNKWMDREALENYRHAMRICCMNALHVCSDEALSELCYDLDISRNGDASAYEHRLGGQCRVITSEPGGGKSYLIYYFLGYRDGAIGRLYGRCRSLINRRRDVALKQLRKE